MSFARLLTSRPGSFTGNICRILRSSLTHACIGVLALCGGMSVIAPEVVAQTVVATVALGYFPVGAAVNSVTNMVYVANYSGNSVTVINGATNAVIATVPVGSAPQSVSVNSVTNTIYVPNLFGNSVTVINGATNAVIATVPVGSAPQSVSVNSVTNTIYVPNENSASVTVINGATNTVAATVPVGIEPLPVAVNSVTNMVYVANYGGSSVTVINGATNAVIATVAALGAEAVAVNSVTNMVYVANYGGTVSVINGATNAVIATVPVENLPSLVVVNPVTNTIYVANHNVGSVSIINGNTNTVTATVAALGASAVVVNPVTNTIYVANNSSNTVAVINGATNTVAATVLVGSDPAALALDIVTNTVYVPNYVGESVSVIVNQVPSTVAVSCAPNPFSYGVGNNTTCTANVTGGTTPTGTLTWTINGAAWTSSTLSSGSAEATGLTSDTAGTYTISAAYSGDSGHTSSSGSTTVSIVKGSPLMSASCSPNPVAYLGYYSCTAALGSGVTGSVTWPGVFGGATTSLSGGATSTPSYQATGGAGSYGGTATYNGDANNNSVSESVGLTVNKVTPSLSVSCSPNPITYGSQTTNCSSSISGGGSPTGTETWTINGGGWTSTGLNGSAGGFASWAAGTYTIGVSYGGDANNNAVSTSTTLTINKATPVVTVALSAATTAFLSTPTTATIQLSCGSSCGAGQVDYRFDGAEWGTVSLSASGGFSAARLSTDAVGVHTIQINFLGNANYAAVNSSVMTWTVTQAVPTVSLVCTPVSPTVGQSTTCTAAVPANDGTVAFYSPTSLTGQWWNSQNPAGGDELTPPVAITHDGSLNYNDSTYSVPGIVQAPSGVDPSYIYARWTGTFVSTIGGTYTIGVNVDDGANVYVNGTEVVSSLANNQGAAGNLTYTQSGTIALTAGATNTIVVEYANNVGGGMIQLLWTPPGQSSPSLLGWSIVPVNSSGQAVIAGNVLTPGASTISAVWSGDANYSSGSATTTVSETANTVTQLTSSLNPSTSGQDVTFTSLVNTGGGTPTAGVTFQSGGSDIGTGTITPVSNTNYLRYSTNFGSWLTNDSVTITPNAVTAPDGTQTATQLAVGSGGGYYIIDSFACQAGVTTYSVWEKQTSYPSPYLVLSVRFADASGNNLLTAFPASVPTSNWTRYSTTQTAPVGTASCTMGLEQNATGGGGTGLPGQGVYVWGAQVEQASQAGPYIATNGAENSGYGGLATFTTSALPVGADSITANYIGDAVNAASTSPVLSQVVTKVTPTVAVSCSPNAITFGGQTTTCMASLGSGVTGAVAVTYNGNPWGWPALSGGTSSQVGFNGQPAGSYNIVVNYSGDANNSAVSGSTTLTINKATGVFAVSSSANPVVPGANVTFTCVGTAGGQPLLNGAYIAFWVDGTLIENVPTTGGLLQWSTSALSTGSHAIGCSGGDANYNSAGSPNYTEVVSQTPTMTTLSSSLNPSTSGLSVTLTSMVNTGGVAPTGSVTFQNGATSVGTGPISTVSATNLIPDSNYQDGSTYWTLNAFPIVNGVGGMLGGNAFVYTGTGNAASYSFNASSVIAVIPGATYTLSGFIDATAVTSGAPTWYVFSPDISTGYLGFGISAGTKGRVSGSFTVPAGVTEVVVICDTSNLTASNGGQVIWSEPQLEQASQMGPYVLTGISSTTGYGGLATLTTSTLQVGTNSITAVYGGDAINLASTSAVLPEVVTQATPTIAAVCSPNPVAYLGYYSCTATLGSGATGTVTWPAWVGVTSTTLSSGTATTGAMQALGVPEVYSGMVTYNGDSNNTAVSGSLSLTSIAAPQTITFAALATPVTYGAAPIALSATATSGLPVTFAVISGPATISGSTLTIMGDGTVVVAANQAGNGDIAAAAQVTQSVVVNQAPTMTTLSSSLNPSTFGQNVTLTSLVNTGGTAPTGSVTFQNGGTSIGSGTVSTASTTNLLPYSLMGGAGWDGYLVTLTPNNQTDPTDGTNASTLEFPASSGGESYLEEATGLTPPAGSTYTMSVWMKSSTNSTVLLRMVQANGSGDTVLPVNVTNVWQRYSFTNPTPFDGTASLLWRLNEMGVVPDTTVSIYGAQLEQSASVGPYVATNGESLPGSGGLASITTSALPAEPDGITAVYSGDSNDSASIAPALSQVVNGAIAMTLAVPATTLTQNHSSAPFSPVTATGGTGTLQLSVAPTLPAGLSFSTATGVISGSTSAALPNSVFTVTATDANNATASAAFHLTVDSPITVTPTILSTTLTQGQPAIAFTPATATGGDGTLVLTVSPALPAGLAFSATTGTISGTATGILANTPFTVTATDLNGASATGVFNITVDGSITATPVIPATTLTQGHASASFAPVTATGGDGTLTLSVSPALPSGLSFSSTGMIAGTATVATPTSTYTVTVTDLNGATATAAFNITVDSPIIANPVIPATILTQGHASASFAPVTATGGDGTLIFTVSPALPSGLTFSATGLVSGTATATIGSTPFTVTVSDINGASATAAFNLTVDSTLIATPVIASTTVTQGRLASVFTPVTGTGGYGALTFSVSPTLPAGLSFSTTTAAVSGTATVASASTVYTVSVTDLNNATASAVFTLAVDSSIIATPAVASTTLTQGQPATAFTPVTATGGDGALTLAVSPALPAGLGFSTASGLVSGTATATIVNTPFTVTATDVNGASAMAVFNLTVDGSITATPAVASTTLTQGHAATAFTPVSATGGDGTLAFTVSPTLPAGLSFSNAGAISGTATAPSTAASYTVTVKDVNNATATAAFSLSVDSSVTAVQVIPSTNLTQGRAATMFTPVTASGGNAPLVFSVSPALPSGLALNSTNGAVSGTAAGSSVTTTYTVTATDVNSASGSASFGLMVAPMVTGTTVTPNSFFTRNLAAMAFTPVTATGGISPLTFTIVPTLPAGLTFSSTTGLISGIATVPSPATSYAVTATDTNGSAATSTFNLTVYAVSMNVVVPVSTATQNRPVAAFVPVVGVGGSTPYTYSVSPTLPAGLSFTPATGSISGTPTVSGATVNYTVTVTDATGASAAGSFSLTVDGVVTATTVIALNNATENSAASFAPVLGAGGVGPLVYTVSPALPAGLSMAANGGLISGTPTVSLTTSTFTVTVTDVNGSSAAKTFALTVHGPVAATTVIPSTTLTQGTAVMAFAPVTGSGGAGSWTYSVSPGLPAGLSMAAGTGSISGKPTSSISLTTYTVTVTDAANATATATFTLSVTAVPVTATTLIPSTNLTQNRLAPVFTPVSGTGGASPITFSVLPALPAGLSMSTMTGAVSGTPTGTSPSSTYTVTVTDSNNSSAQANFVLGVNSPAVVATTAIPLATLTVNVITLNFTPVTGSGGAGPLTYSVLPALPSGLTFSATTGALGGDPTAQIAATTFTVTVTDGSSTANASFVLTVGTAVTAKTVKALNTLTEGNPTSFTPVTGSGGTTPLTYTVLPALPAGLSMASSTGTITGTATVPLSSSTFTVTVTDATGAHSAKTFNLTVDGRVVATTVIPVTSLSVNVTATSFKPVTGSGGDGALKFTVSPALPSGLSLATTTGAITGKPTVVSPSTDYTMTLTDTIGATATTTFSLAVTP